MDLKQAIIRMDRNREAIGGLVSGIPDAQARWRPEEKRWSILEVINHLVDEERDDFRLRLSLLLEQPGEPWPPIDPEAWARERNYNARDLGASFAAWLEERNRSLDWLRGLGNVDLQRPYGLAHLGGYHERLSSLRAGDLLVSWVAHDLLHLRQLAKLHVLHLAETPARFSTEYAGRL